MVTELRYMLAGLCFFVGFALSVVAFWRVTRRAGDLDFYRPGYWGLWLLIVGQLVKP